MHWRTSNNHWGWVSIGFHWVTAIVVLAQFGLGLWMVNLTLYDPWYNEAPHLHKSIGILLFMFTLLRLGWRVAGGRPIALPTHSAWEQRLAITMHALLYVLLFTVMFMGYLIPTADGRSIDVFNWFSVPATLYGINKQEDIAGAIHLWLAVTLLRLPVLHATAPIKHHVHDKDNTLKRMLGL